MSNFSKSARARSEWYQQITSIRTTAIASGLVTTVNYKLTIPNKIFGTK